MFFCFFHFGTLQNRGSRLGVVTISRKCNENDNNFGALLCSLFLPKFQVFGINQEHLRHRKCCVLQIKLNNFVV